MVVCLNASACLDLRQLVDTSGFLVTFNGSTVTTSTKTRFQRRTVLPMIIWLLFQYTIEQTADGILKCRKVLSPMDEKRIKSE